MQNKGNNKNNKNVPIINIVTYGLPGKLARQIYNEFQDRFRNAVYLIDNFNTYNNLQNNKKTVELLLALSIFHKRIILSYEGANNFYNYLNKHGDIKIVKMGNFDFSSEKNKKIKRIIMSYRDLLDRINLDYRFMDYSETKDFLKKLILLKNAKKTNKENNFTF